MSPTRAEARRAKRAKKPDLFVAVAILREQRDVTDDPDLAKATRFAFGFLNPAATGLTWTYDWHPPVEALALLNALVRASPPERLRRHYQDLSATLRGRTRPCVVLFARAPAPRETLDA